MEDSGVYRTLLASSRAIPWKIDWVSKRLVYNGPQIEAPIGFMFDISKRMKSEQKRLRLKQQLEELSFKDGLAGVAHRRTFDGVSTIVPTRDDVPVDLIERVDKLLYRAEERGRNRAEVG